MVNDITLTDKGNDRNNPPRYFWWIMDEVFVNGIIFDGSSNIRAKFTLSSLKDKGE